MCYDEIVFGTKPAAGVNMGGGGDNVHEDMEKEVCAAVLPELQACSRGVSHPSPREQNHKVH